MVKRRQFIITITSTFLLLGLFYKVPQHRNDVDRDGFQNDPAIYEDIYEGIYEGTNFHWSPQQNLLWCKVPKAGSTTWVQIFLSLVGAGFGAVDVEQRGQDSTQDATSGDEKLENRIRAISIMHGVFDSIFPPLPLNKTQEITKSALSFMIVRHPLDRFLAAYLDKKGLGVHDAGVGNRSWPQFVQHMLEIPKESWDMHWAPIHTICPPCIRYDIVARMETFLEDSEYVIHRAGLSNISVPWRNKQSVGSSFKRNLSFYGMLSEKQVQALVNIYRLDFELYGYDPEPFLWMASKSSQ